MRTADRIFTVTFPYNLKKDNITTLANEMKKDLNLGETNIQRAERKLQKAIKKYKRKYALEQHPMLTIDSLDPVHADTNSPNF